MTGRETDSDREQACAGPLVPASMADDVAGYQWVRSTVGESGGAAYRLHGRPGAPDLYLKHGTGDVADDLTDEMLRLRWMAQYTPVPAVRRFVSAPGEAWLLMTVLPGETAYQVMEARPHERAAIVDALARFLRRLHAIPVSRCPFTSGHDHRLEQARARIDAGLVEEDDFDAEREGWTAEQVWDAMQSLLPFIPDPVVTHGDFSLDNILIAGGEVVGCIDVGRAGIADRYQDLAILWNCLSEFDGELQARLFERYGIVEPDRRKLHFHLMLDEMF